jgi:predicted AlkP superfamily phosphohydrolase/phosphomutase
MREKLNIARTLRANIISGSSVGFIVAIVVTGVSVNLNFLWNNFHDFLILLLFALIIKILLWSLIGLLFGIVTYLFGQISKWPFLTNNIHRIAAILIFHTAFFLYGFLNIASSQNIAGISSLHFFFVLIGIYATSLLLLILSRRSLMREEARGEKKILLICGVALLIFISCMWVSSKIYSSGSRPISIPNQPSETGLMIIGVDAAGWDMIVPLVAAGKLPNIGSLMKTGIYGDLETIQPTSSPVIWTTIATGKNYNKHGVSNFVKYRLANSYYSTSIPSGFGFGTILKYLSHWTNGKLCEPIATSGRSIKTSLLWEMLNMAGKEVAVLGWWCTWPVQPVNGYIVSDHYDEMLQKENNGTTHTQTIYPPDLAEKLRPYSRDIAEQVTSELSRFINMPKQDFGHILSTSEHPTHEAFSQLEHVYFEDLIQKQAVTFILEKTSPELVCVYFRGVDIVGHYFWKYCHPSDYHYRIKQSEIDVFGETISAYYEFVDEAIGEILSLTDENYAIMIISDHRMGSVSLGDPGAPRSGGHRGAISGIFIFSGKPFKSNQSAHNASILDITPTALQLFGLPQAQDFDGRVLTEMLSPEYHAQVIGSPIRSYDRGAKPTSAEKSPMDREIKERLKGLGYIQ